MSVKDPAPLPTAPFLHLEGTALQAMRLLLIFSALVLLLWGIASPSLSLLLASGIVFATIPWADRQAGKRLRRVVAASLRGLARVLVPRIWRVRTIGLENIPGRGGAVFICNRTSIIDPLLLMSVVRRPVHFIVPSAEMKRPILGPILKILGAIRLETTSGQKALLRSLRYAGRYAVRGRLVCVFAEGDLTRIGMMLPFRRGLERLNRSHSAPLVPVCLETRWACPMDVDSTEVSTIRPPIRTPLWACFGKPLPADIPLSRVRTAIQDLSADLWTGAMAEQPPLTGYLVRRMRTRFWRPIAADPQHEGVSRWGLLSGAVAWAHAWQSIWHGQKSVAILLPPGVPAATANTALALSGRASVNLNYTSGAANMISAIRQAGIRTVMTSRRFVDKIGFAIPNDLRIIEIDGESARLDLFFRLIAALFAIAAPVSWLEYWCGAEKPVVSTDTVTTIFTSGSTGEPKGVPLTHRNIAADCLGTSHLLRVTDADTLLGILPLFHSFGYMFLWFSLIHGIKIVFHPSPLEAGPIGDSVEKHRVSLLITTPTFLQLYLKKVAPEKFRSLRLVLTGAEKLPDRLARAFGERFNIKPIEGYGTSECAPVVSTSSPGGDVGERGQVGYRRGFVGHPLPGVAVKIIDPDTGAVLPHRQPGMLLVKGPNVMTGYLDRPAETASVLRDGWYSTGDLAYVDDDGFLRITDRINRFSKIGGEMIPHGRVEEALHEAAGSDSRVFAVTAVADNRRGERLAVLHTLSAEELVPVIAKLQTMGLPNLYIPKREQFYRVEMLPVLGSGKLDLKGMKQVAAARAKAADIEAAARKEVKTCPAT